MGWDEAADRELEGAGDFGLGFKVNWRLPGGGAQVAIQVRGSTQLGTGEKCAGVSHREKLPSGRPEFGFYSAGNREPQSVGEREQCGKTCVGAGGANLEVRWKQGCHGIIRPKLLTPNHSAQVHAGKSSRRWWASISSEASTRMGRGSRNQAH